MVTVKHTLLSYMLRSWHVNRLCHNLPTNKHDHVQLHNPRTLLVLTVGETVRVRGLPECRCIASSNGGQTQVEVLEGGPPQPLAVSSILHAHTHGQSAKTPGCLAEGNESAFLRP